MTLYILILLILSGAGIFFSGTTTWGDTVFDIASLALALLYFIYGFAILNKTKLSFKAAKDLSFNQAFFGTATGWTIATIIVGAFFKLRMWPGAQVLLWIGIIGTLIMIVVNYILYKKDEESKTLFQRSLVHGIIAIIIGAWILSASQEHIISLYIQDDNDQKDVIEAYHDWQKNPSDSTLHMIYLNKFNETLKKQKQQ